jgi:hypothetical protein
MLGNTVYTLVISSVRGRYALDDPLHDQDLTSGQALAILLGGHWIEGSIEHAGGLYALEIRPCHKQCASATAIDLNQNEAEWCRARRRSARILPHT